MDDYSGKRNGDGVIVSRKGSALVLRESDNNNRDRNAQFCNRIGCNGRPNSSKVTQINYSEKAKSSKPSFRPSTGKEIIGSSSKVCSATGKSRKSSLEPRKKLSSHLEIDSSETSSSHDEPEVPELISPPHGHIQRGLPESDESGSSEITTSTDAGSSTATSTRSCRSFHQKSELGNPVTLAGSPVSLASKSTGQGARGNMSRYGMRNLKCNSISDVIPSGTSSSDSYLSRKKGTIKKRISEGESSSSTRGKKMSGPSVEGKNSSSSPGISISDSRRARGGLAGRDNSDASVRTRRLLNGYSRARFVDQGIGNNVSPNECRFMIPQMSQADLPIDLNASSSSQLFSVETSLHRPSSYSQPGSGNESLRGIRPSSPAELGNSRSLMNRESFRRYNMDGIAEVLLALERIEQDEELTYEQVLVLETNLFLNGLNFYDQHREMRLDIDNMSYEELLALEERMGNVSTALPEEALSECLKMGVYEAAPAEDAPTNLSGDPNDVKCSVCQEEYAVGDEVGRLHCEHRYHAVCIQQWLRLKNWCPICKASAAPSSARSPTPPPATCQFC